jgi:phosphatidylglycerophosphatase A
LGHKSNKALADRVASLPTPAQRWPRWIVSGGGPGFLRPAPGSWGTALPAGLFWLALCQGMQDPRRSLAFLAFGLVASVLLIAYGKWAAAYYREPDPGTVVLDEYAGFAVTAAFVPVPPWCVDHGTWGLFLFTAGLYILFRATDTLKIPPANYLERLPWGWGILCDDLAAGVQANLIAQLVVRMWLIPR